MSEWLNAGYQLAIIVLAFVASVVALVWARQLKNLREGVVAGMQPFQRTPVEKALAHVEDIVSAALDYAEETARNFLLARAEKLPSNVKLNTAVDFVQQHLGTLELPELTADLISSKIEAALGKRRRYEAEERERTRQIREGMQAGADEEPEESVPITDLPAES